ncbi:MAG TPA: molybdate ABC transporter permease subunit, partial [Ornithinibacter sp.]|nr:molybdate ABC transporter permease subunit [Ornithinibacter sp.]
MTRSVRQRTRRSTAPWPLAVPAAVGVTFLLVPLAAMLLRTPWSSLPDILRDPAVLDALRLSLVTATSSTAVAVVLGVPLAWVLARTHFRGLSLLRALVTLPLVLPPVVGGVALLLAFGRLGVVGRWLDEWFGFTLPFTT